MFQFAKCQSTTGIHSFFACWQTGESPHGMTEDDVPHGWWFQGCWLALAPHEGGPDPENDDWWWLSHISIHVNHFNVVFFPEWALPGWILSWKWRLWTPALPLDHVDAAVLSVPKFFKANMEAVATIYPCRLTSCLGKIDPQYRKPYFHWEIPFLATWSSIKWGFQASMFGSCSHLVWGKISSPESIGSIRYGGFLCTLTLRSIEYPKLKLKMLQDLVATLSILLFITSPAGGYHNLGQLNMFLELEIRLLVCAIVIHHYPITLSHTQRYEF